MCIILHANAFIKHYDKIILARLKLRTDNLKLEHWRTQKNTCMYKNVCYVFGYYNYPTVVTSISFCEF